MPARKRQSQASPKKLTIDLRDLRKSQNEHFWPLFTDKHRYLVLRGGAGSGKSWFVAEKILIRLVSEPGHRFLLVRNKLKDVHHSVYDQIKEIAELWGWSKSFQFNKTDYSITFLPTGADMVSVGLDDEDRLKSITKVTGVWIEEASQIKEAAFEEIDRRMRAKLRPIKKMVDGKKVTVPNYHQMILSFNPVSIHSWVKRRFWDITDPEEKAEIKTDVSLFTDNRFLDPAQHKKIMRYKKNRPMDWRIYGLAQWGVTEGHVYSVDMEGVDWPKRFDDECYGVDWGFRNPTAVAWLGSKDLNYRTHEGDVFIREEVYKEDLTTRDLSDLCKRKGMDRRKPMFADAAEPARIREMRRLGWNCFPTRKGRNSVKGRIDLCRSYKLHTEPSSINLNAEFSSYVWDEKANGETADAPVKIDDHLMDAFGGAVWSRFRRRPGIIGLARR